MFDAYKVAVKLSLVNHVSTGLISIASQLNQVNKGFNDAQHSAAELEKRLLNIKRMGLIGGALAAVGYGGMSLFKGPLEEAKKFQTEVAKFSSLGFGSAITSQATEFARGMKTIGTSATENMALVSDAMAVFKDLHHAEMVAPLLAKMKFANQAVFGNEHGSANESKFMDMLKVIEFRGGLSSQKEFATQANFVQKVISGSRNRVDATQLLSALKTGGVALSRRSNEDFYLGSEPLIQEFGGQRYGTGAMSIYQNLVQSRGTITAQQELYRLGLLNPKKVQFNQLGQLKKALPGAFVGSKVLEEEGELSLLEKVLLPAFAAKGITGDEAIIREIGMILGNRTGSGLLSRIYQQRNTIKTQSAANRKAMGIDQMDEEAQKTLTGKEKAFEATWRNFKLALGDTILPMAVKAVQALTSGLRSFVQFAKEYPATFKTLTIAFGALSAAMAFGGTVMLLTSAFKGLGLALTALGAGGAVGMATIAMRAVGGVGLAGAAGYGVGTLLNNYAINPLVSRMTGRENTLGGALYDWLHPNQGFAPAASQTSKGGGGDVYLDGQKVGKIVSGHQAKAMGRPQVGSSTFDGSMNMRLLGSGYAG